MFNERPTPLPCIACHTSLSPASLDCCPRCGADNRAWFTWLSADQRDHLKRFFLRSPWGRLALVSLLLPLIWGALSGLPAFETVVLFLAFLLSLTGLVFLFARRDVLSIHDMARRVSPGLHPELLSLGGTGFLVFIGVAAILVIAWGSEVLGGGPSAFNTLGGGAIVLVGLAFTTQTLGAGLYAVCAYGHWLCRAFPRPVFLDQARLLQLVLRAVVPRIQVKTGDTYEAVAAQVVALSRTNRAGLDVLIRAEAGTDEGWEGHYLKAVQHWRVVSDKWGRVTQLKPQGPLEYLPDLDRVATPFAPGDNGEKVLDGKIIPPEKEIFHYREVRDYHFRK